MIRRGGWDEKLTFLFLLLAGRQYSSSDIAGEKVRPRWRPLRRCCSVLSSSSVFALAIVSEVWTIHTSST